MYLHYKNTIRKARQYIAEQAILLCAYGHIFNLEVVSSVFSTIRQCNITSVYQFNEVWVDTIAGKAYAKYLMYMQLRGVVEQYAAAGIMKYIVSSTVGVDGQYERI